MKIRLSAADDRLTLTFETLDAAATFVRKAAEQGAFMLSLDAPLRQFQRFEVLCKVPPRVSIALDTEVAQTFPSGDGTACALTLRQWTPEARQALDDQLAKALQGEDSEAPSPDDVSPMFRIQSMNVSERLRLAGKAGRTERQILIRDGSPQVLYALLSNPQISDSEVRSIVASNFASAAIMQRVVKNKRWMGKPEVLLALVRSPKTPPPLAIKQLQLLRTSDLQILAKANSTREVIRRAALRIYLQRTGQQRV